MSYEAYMQINGTTQGQFPGESPRPDYAAWIPIIHFNYHCTTPTDVSTGANRGKLVHGEFVVVKEMGQACATVFNAHFNAELIKSVTINFWDRDTGGNDRHTTQIVLTNAVITKTKIYTGSEDAADLASASTAKNTGNFDTRNLHEIRFRFDGITFSNILNNTAAGTSFGNSKIAQGNVGPGSNYQGT